MMGAIKNSRSGWNMRGDKPRAGRNHQVLPKVWRGQVVCATLHPPHHASRYLQGMKALERSPCSLDRPCTSPSGTITDEGRILQMFPVALSCPDGSETLTLSGKAAQKKASFDFP